MENDGFWYHVIVRKGSDLHNQGVYRHEKSAGNRANKIQGGEVIVFKTFTSDPEQAVSEFRDEEVRGL